MPILAWAKRDQRRSREGPGQAKSGDHVQRRRNDDADPEGRRFGQFDTSPVALITAALASAMTGGDYRLILTGFETYALAARHERDSGRDQLWRLTSERWCIRDNSQAAPTSRPVGELSMSSRYEQILEANASDTPSPWRVFARRRPFAPRDPAIMWDSLAYGYQRAADIVAKEFCDRDRNQILSAPIFFLYRHYIELRLKGAWQEYFSRGWLNSGPPNNKHDLLVLWNTIREASVNHGLFHAVDEFVARVQKSIELFDSIDRRSTHSRYPEVGGEFHSLDLDVEVFVRAVDDIDTFFFGLGARIDIHDEY